MSDTKTPRERLAEALAWHQPDYDSAQEFRKAWLAPDQIPDAPSAPGGGDSRLRDLVVAVYRMRDDWAESGEEHRQTLWRAVMTAAKAFEVDVFPMQSAPEGGDAGLREAATEWVEADDAIRDWTNENGNMDWIEPLLSIAARRDRAKAAVRAALAKEPP